MLLSFFNKVSSTKLFAQIYKEDVFDLFSRSQERESLAIREDSGGAIKVRFAHQRQVPWHPRDFICSFHFVDGPSLLKKWDIARTCRFPT